MMEFDIEKIISHAYTPAYHKTVLGVMSFERATAEPICNICGDHWVLEAVTLSAFSDESDTLTGTSKQNMFRHSLKRTRGNIFFLKDYESGNAIFVSSEAPDFQASYLSVTEGRVTLENGENPFALGTSSIDGIYALCREYYRSHLQSRIPVCMSNTWGDRNGFSRICEKFVLDEITAASEIGIDIVQIDDGWQTGNTADKTQRDELNRRYFSGDYWKLNEQRFPNGLEPIIEAARSKKLKIGLWFAPESHDSYYLLERDIAVLKHAYDEWGARFFKLDMYWIEDNEDKARFMTLLNSIRAFGDDVSVQLDVTRDKRVNYLCAKENGTVFVENRYTKGGNSFPHRVLRNLWNFSKVLPSTRFLFEVVNPDLNCADYSPRDPFAPREYDMDYLFAITMTANPLFWMELQHLSPNRRAQLEPLMKLWREWRRELYDADVIPVGEEPTGRSLTGFYISKRSGSSYLLAFRESTFRNSLSLDIDTATSSCEIIATNGSTKATVCNGKITVDFSKEKEYALIKIS